MNLIVIQASGPTKTGWWRHLLAAIAALAVVLLGAVTASATTLPEVETRVGASTPVAVHVVGPHECIAVGQRWGHAPPRADVTAGFCVAANTVDDVARLADDAVVVRGGTSDVPPAGEVFSGAFGQTLDEAGAYVPYGQLRATTAGEIRLGGGTVDVVPEMTRGGNLNPNHVNICLGPGSCPFGPLVPIPVPKPGRIQ